LAWELDFWGRFRRNIAAATDELDANIENYDAVLVTLVADVAQTYVDIRTLETQIALARANVKLQQGTLQLTEIRFKEGATTDLDVQQAKANLAQTEALIPVLETALRQAQNQLCVLLGEPPYAIQQTIGSGAIPSTPIEVAVGIPADLIRRRPDLRRAERELAAQGERIGIAVAELYPHISIIGTYGLQSSKLSSLFEPQSQAGSIGPSLQWNILNYGRLINGVRVQDARFQELALFYQNQVLTAQQEVENGLVAFLQAQLQARYLQEAVNASAKSVELAIIQYREGKVDFNRVFLLERDLVQQQNDLAQARGNVAQGLIQVYRALGGGWQIRLDPPQGPVEIPPATSAEQAPVVPLEQLPAPKDVKPKL
jgi:NodT family efflux transporter outer membrane factor (OMF) lipoprotein